jgi:hypothetical protein
MYIHLHCHTNIVLSPTTYYEPIWRYCRQHDQSSGTTPPSPTPTQILKQSDWYSTPTWRQPQGPTDTPHSHSPRPRPFPSGRGLESCCSGTRFWPCSRHPDSLFPRRESILFLLRLPPCRTPKSTARKRTPAVRVRGLSGVR